MSRLFVSGRSAAAHVIAVSTALIVAAAWPARAHDWAGALIAGGGAGGPQVEIDLGSTVVSSNGRSSIAATLHSTNAGVVATLNDIVFPAGGEVFIPQREITATLAEDLSADALEILLQPGQAQALPSFGIVVIDEEEISYLAIDGDTLIVAARGDVPSAHAKGSEVRSPFDVPECRMAPALGIPGVEKDVVFAFLPDGCTPSRATCTPGVTCCLGVRAIVIALDNLNAIPDGTFLYACTVEAGEATGTFALPCPQGPQGEFPFQPAMSGASPLEIGGNLPTTCVDATVTVSDSASVVLKVGSAMLPPGGEATVDLTLTTMGQPVIELLTDLAFGRHVAIVQRIGAATTLASNVGKDDVMPPIPDCEPSEALLSAGKTAEFSFLPDGCTPGLDCSTVRAVVVSSDDFQPIPAGTPLYRCRVRAGKEEGSFPLACPYNEAVSSGLSDAPVACEDGTIVVTTPRGGDCDLDGCVDVNEVVRGVGVALGSTPIDDCRAIDANRDEAATVDELISAVENSVNGCEGR
jgi:hypothetical protein